MPKRHTLTFSSDDAPVVQSSNLHVYYCKYSGKHALTTDLDLEKAPRRRTDGAAVLDTEKYQVKLYTADGGIKLIKRKSGAVEKQHRLNLGKLPVAYRSEPDGRYVYVLENAVTTYGVGQDASGGGRPPTPPCIKALDLNTTEIGLEIDDHAEKASLLKISADFVRVEVRGSVTTQDANEDLLELMRSLLGVRLSALSLVRGKSTRHKALQVMGLTPEQVFDKLRGKIKA